MSSDTVINRRMHCVYSLDVLIHDVDMCIEAKDNELSTKYNRFGCFAISLRSLIDDILILINALKIEAECDDRDKLDEFLDWCIKWEQFISKSAVSRGRFSDFFDVMLILISDMKKDLMENKKHGFE